MERFSRSTGQYILLPQEPPTKHGKVARFIFFVSTGRTGTHFLADLFNRHSGSVAAYHEPKPSFKRRGYELVARDSTLWERLYFSAFRRWRFYRSGKRDYVEANNNVFSAIPLIRRCFPGAVVVHIVRDGREVVRSYVNAKKRYAHQTETNLSPEHFPGDPYMELWPRMNALQRTAWFWVRVNEVIERSQPDHTVLFEDFFLPPYRAFFNLMEVVPELNLSAEAVDKAFRTPAHSSRHGLIPDHTTWPASWRQQFLAIAGDKMKQYGYPVEDWASQTDFISPLSSEV